MELNFDKVYEEQYDKLYKLAYRLTANKQEAEDVLQEAFLNAYSAFPKFQNKSQISTWLYRIVVNCSYKNMKKLKRRELKRIQFYLVLLKIRINYIILIPG